MHEHPLLGACAALAPEKAPFGVVQGQGQVGALISWHLLYASGSTPSHTHTPSENGGKPPLHHRGTMYPPALA